MSGKNEKIKKRAIYDDESFTQSFYELSSVVMGKSAIARSMVGNALKTRDAVAEILKYFKITPPDAKPPEDVMEQLDFYFRPEGIMRRRVKLSGKWYKAAVGPMLAQTESGGVVALIPKGMHYEFYDYEQDKRLKVNRKTAGLIGEEAICFYAPLPQRELGIKDLLVYMIKCLTKADIAVVALAALFATLLGMIGPFMSRLIFGMAVPADDPWLLGPITVLLVGAALSITLIKITKLLALNRISTKVCIPVQAAAMARTLSLPIVFFRETSAGDLSNRLKQISQLCGQLTNTVLSTALTALFSLAYVAQIFNFAPSLVWPAVTVLLATLCVMVAGVLIRTGLTRKRIAFAGKLTALVFSLFSGLQKIKTAGAEKRAFAQWAKGYKKTAEILYSPPMFVKLEKAITSVISMAGMVAIYYCAATSGVSTADYMAFNTSYGMVSGALLSLSGIAAALANIKPMLEAAAPILKSLPETGKIRRVVNNVSGGVELTNVTFKYSPKTPNIIDNLSLKIEPGQYVAIVGKTGCGKSTLMRLLLGFESPQKGAVYYDGIDLANLDVKSLRRKIGVVLQNGKLFQGDIFSNIIISAPWLTLDDAWEAAELAGIADDIRAMPMGMHTMIGEGNGGISGGQRQRLMIARAIAPKPKILMFDEATSALDNETQKKVSDSLDGLNSTRIVIAHRLSTIRHCDRIVVIEGGRIIEDGNYDSLMLQNGTFAELVARQRLDKD